MARQEHANKSKSQAKREEVLEEAAKTEEATKSEQDLKDELDSMLDEIDSVLEENAAEFIAGYILEGRRIDLARTPRR